MKQNLSRQLKKIIRAEAAAGALIMTVGLFALIATVTTECDLRFYCLPVIVEQCSAV